MALQKQTVSVNFSLGIDTKTDPFQLPIGRFESLVNVVFDKLGQMRKRYGFPALGTLPDGSATALTTYSGNLLAIGKKIRSYSRAPMTWRDVGQFEPMEVSTLSLVKNLYNQTYVDSAYSSNGLIMATYSQTESGVSKHYYTVVDSDNGQSVVPPTQIQSTFGTVSYSAKVFCLSNNFVCVFGALGSASAYALQYIAVSTIQPSIVSSVTTLNTSFAAVAAQNFDGVVANNSLYLAWGGTSNTGVRATALDSFLRQSSTVTVASGSACLMSVCADTSNTTPTIYASYAVGTTTSTIGRIVAFDSQLNTFFSARQFTSSASATIANLASTADQNQMLLFYESSNVYGYSSTSGSNYISKLTITETGSASAISTVARGVGLASKGFLVSSTSYVFSAFSSDFQPSYFLINSTGQVSAKLAYQNGRGYLSTGLPTVTVFNQSAQVSYLLKDFITPVNKLTNASSQTATEGIYTSLGANVATLTYGTSGLSVKEAAGNIHLNGGIFWQYDGARVVEHNFLVYPDNVQVRTVTTSGSLSAQTYYYQAVYEWSDNQGNIYRSAPSIPVGITTSGSTSSNVLNIPALRLTYKDQTNPSQIGLYRWSTNQQIYFKVTSITQTNPTAGDYFTYTDVNSDAEIIGNEIIYTNGGVIEDIAAPPARAMTLFDSRMWLIDAEDGNTLWFSKQLIKNTPVEWSDLFTVYVDPSIGASGPTGPMQCIFPMDDKLIVFKKNAIYFINGNGPDNTGASNQYSPPIFITSTIGCENPDSIVLTPNGLMFQSDKGIWLLGRDLSTQYVGKDVEAYNDIPVLSAVNVPATNEVRFTLSSGITLMYDYFVNQWGTFEGIAGIASTIYQNAHTYINASGQAFQEQKGTYLDGSNPVLMSFRTGWLNFAGIQGYKRIYEMYMLGQYKSPHKLTFGIGYDFDSNITQLAVITPDNYSAPWGSDATYGDSEFYGGNSDREQWQINFAQQQCQSIQLNFNEYFDPSIGVAPGAGLTLSAISLLAGIKSSGPKNIPAKHRTG